MYAAVDSREVVIVYSNTNILALHLAFSTGSPLFYSHVSLLYTRQTLCLSFYIHVYFVFSIRKWHNNNDIQKYIWDNLNK